MFVVLKSGDEIIVTTKKKEVDMIDAYFSESSERELDDYDREEINDSAVMISSSLRIW